MQMVCGASVKKEKRNAGQQNYTNISCWCFGLELEAETRPQHASCES